MKNFKTLLFITLMSSFCLTAQNKDTQRADKHFARYEFVKAAESYNKLVENGKGDAYVYSQLAESYYNIFDTQAAERWYAKALESSDKPEMIYRYSEMLKANGKYEASNQQMKRFASMRPADARAIAFNKNPDYLPKILEQGKKFNVQNAPFNSEQSDFGGTLHDGKLYFASARNDSRKTYGWNEEPFLDIYSVSKNTDGTYLEPELANSTLNTRHHEGLVSITPDGKTMFFSRESYYEKDYEKDSLSTTRFSQIYLYKATKVGNDWDTVESLPFNSENYTVKNPSVSSDGKTLYFSSNMPGGFGSYDIYKAPINDDGTVGEPVNLGQKVNTEGQEMFPYISSDNTLYFSSTGHLGLGGLDVFYTKEIDGKFAPIRNAGIPINSNSDDFAFTIDEETGEGFVSSNRAGGKGSDDIYIFKKLQPLCDVLITATVLDDTTREPLSGATVSLHDSQGNKVVTKTTNAEGIAEFIVECEEDTELEVVMDGFDSKKVSVKGSSEEETDVQISLDPIEKLILADNIDLETIYFDFDKSNITAAAAFELDKLVQIMQKYPELVIKATSHTDNRGSESYNQGLSDRRAKTTVQYVISKGIDESRISGEGKGESEPKVDCSSGCTREQHAENRRSEFLIVSGGTQEVKE
ncbi:outer membrane protein OmpA-like peptidoglycan-associated protein [Winogradskyella epiphytica]|uniref:Outer membrane protein OmpA-like peptidoglycan-associated protein n=1 Tax=Winogradskyella epiphytica TaxID=262005 RepID=A0A2V4X157_9FLAO|nr:OmpA family protein [Winogradskyella epiphytica]PYE83408.1 outer membrane protein OmpA-like peptidoglycan-associated protein [Winogradskyella epiphytica]GGW57934.1 cell envelope biogenesis protein OmpA [Winogradskyella epiphytica]